MKYKSYTLRSIDSIPQLQQFSDQTISDMKVVANVLPFKTNEYVINELIDWDQVPHDPIFQLMFPQKEMLQDFHFKMMRNTLLNFNDPVIIKKTADFIRNQLNPHPAGQKKYNIPTLDEIKLMECNINTKKRFYSSLNTDKRVMHTVHFALDGLNSQKWRMKNLHLVT